MGTTTVDILTLGAVHEGIAFPLVWTMLDRKGTSNTDERIDLMERFHKLFPNVEVRCLTTDREFVGGDWLSYRRLAKSVFRYGFDPLRHISLNLTQP